MMALGLSNREIAEQLFVGEATVTRRPGRAGSAFVRRRCSRGRGRRPPRRRASVRPGRP
ncbi:hypothetical protein [Micromonospora globbae]|uniref:hypothetical protein n=1 Tax=Micromonospora globbae TaxID=1894969 RepID=UPI003431BCFC